MATPTRIVGIGKLDGKLRRFASSIAQNKALMAKIGNYARFQVLARTAQGMDAEGAPFKEYSPFYKEYREAMGLPVEKVDLFFTGSMTSSLTFEAVDDKVSLFFMGTTDKTGVRNPEKAYYNQQTRNFFSLSEEDVDGVEQIVRKYISDRMA